jgi:acylphosphatase
VSVRRRVIVHGRVQGVLFRARCRGEARRLGVAGWVRNLADGTVAAVFEGEPDAVAAMVEWAHVGPDRARVTGVEVLAEEPEGLTDFRVA